MNIYKLMDNELARLHDALARQASRPSEYYSSTDGLHYSAGNQTYNSIARRIEFIQDKMIEAFMTHDAEVQKKVAELALTGDSRES